MFFIFGKATVEDEVKKTLFHLKSSKNFVKIQDIYQEKEEDRKA